MEKVDEKTKKLREINSELEIRIKKEVDENLKKDRLLSQQQKMISMGQMLFMGPRKTERVKII